MTVDFFQSSCYNNNMQQTKPAMNKVFPISVPAVDYYHYVYSAPLACEIWMRIRKENQSWYAVGLDIINETSVHLYVYRMQCNIYGGIGDLVYDQEVTNLTKSELKKLNERIDERYTALAGEEFIRREEKARQDKILEIRKEMFNV